MNKHFKSLELDKILILLSKETALKEAAQKALKLEPQTDISKVEKLINETYDAHMLIGRFGAPSFGGVSNVANALRRADAGGCLNNSELLSIAAVLNVIKGVKDWRKKSASVESSLDRFFLHYIQILIYTIKLSTA